MGIRTCKETAAWCPLKERLHQYNIKLWEIRIWKEIWISRKLYREVYGKKSLRLQHVQIVGENCSWMTAGNRHFVCIAAARFL